MSGQVGLRPDGQKSAPVEILSLPHDKITKVVSGNDHTVALTESGDIYTWGCADQGQLGRVAGYFSSRGGRRGLDFVLIPRKVRLRRDIKFKDIFAGSFCTFAIARDSELVYVWGLNNYGQLATGDTNSSHFPKKSKALSDLNTNIDCPIRIASGQHHSIFSTADGKVYSAGRADYGRLGIGKDASDQNLPAEVQGLSERKVHRVSCGEVVSFGVTEEGQAYSWGMGSCLQLGSGDDEDVWDPMLVEGKKLVVDEHEVLNVEAGGQHTLILARKK